MGKGIFRFSNAVSDIDKFIDTYRKLHAHFKGINNEGKYFDHTQAAIYLAMNGLATSLGAVGAEALSRSTRADKSRDPLYNQHKSYSEMFRMLGWYEPGNKQTNFKLTEYGGYICSEDIDLETLKKLVSLNLLHIVSPNPLIDIRGRNILRPFPMILELMNRLGGVLSRDEMIIGVLACEDDAKYDAVEEAASRILYIRRLGHEALEGAINELMAAQGIESGDTLRNYTRFPIAALKWAGWARSVSLADIYEGKRLKCLELTDKGHEIVNAIESVPDIRYEYLSGYDANTVASFVVLSNLTKLGFVGFDIEPFEGVIKTLRELSKPIYDYFDIRDDRFLFFGYQEAPRSILEYGDELIESLE